ncbi:hypothetical protein I2494_05625 [Budviciaceae bacterium BWR-B9]|uniref:DUF7424 domain-containing protein n=1 Tax=Limnobaculum allomyrinae TaxID=2791986 RepID=A0ABS1IN63_9GAMM|nr:MULTISPECIES: hypothetical protein [Limnobaculum]MBK5143197.1 hypothetical protein [Limnobaculum allomyrinae]MBV7691085.1 hypothetical protein [Limnobaculum sp. M2-1]
MKKIVPVVAVGLLLSGCKVDMNTTVDLNDLMSSTHKAVSGKLSFEVPACSSHEDSRKESKSLTDLKAQVPTIFRNAQFTECYTKQFSSYADFAIPVDVGSMDEPTNMADTDIYIVSSKKHRTLAGIVLNKDLIERIRKAQKNAMNKMDFDISVTINRGDNTLSGYMVGVYQTFPDGKKVPASFAPLNWENAKTLTFTLSDVSTEQLFTDSSYTFLHDQSRFTVNGTNDGAEKAAAPAKTTP